MLKLIHRFAHWLLSEEINTLIHNSEFDKAYIKKSQERENALDVENKLLKQIHDEQKDARLTLDDLVLKPNQIVVLKNIDAEFRQALYDAGEILCLTSPNELERTAIIKYRKYLMNLTRNPTNEIRSDKSAIDKINERKAKFFTPRNADNTK